MTLSKRDNGDYQRAVGDLINKEVYYNVNEVIEFVASSDDGTSIYEYFENMIDYKQAVENYMHNNDEEENEYIKEHYDTKTRAGCEHIFDMIGDNWEYAEQEID